MWLSLSYLFHSSLPVGVVAATPRNIVNNFVKKQLTIFEEENPHRPDLLRLLSP